MKDEVVGLKKWLCCILSILILFQYTATTVFAQERSTPIEMRIDFKPDTQEVTVQGIIDSNSKGDQMSIMVLDPFGSINYIDQKDVLSDGRSSFTFKMEQGNPEGDYIVRLGGTNVSRVTEGTFSYKLDGTQYSLTVKAIIDKNGKLLIEGDVLTLSDKLVGTYLFSHQMKKAI